MLLALINANEVFWAETAKIIMFPPKISNNLAPKFVVKYDLFRAETQKKMQVSARNKSYLKYSLYLCISNL